MARIRKGIAYRRLERPYTRVSKFKKKSFIKTSLTPKTVAFDMGNTKKQFEYSLKMISKSDVQIRDNALNSARETANRTLEKSIGISAFYLKINQYPFHVLRENPLATGAGADRFSTGMQKSFGKPIGQAVRLKRGKTLMTISVEKNNIDIAKRALNKAISKLPCSFTIDIVKK